MRETRNLLHVLDTGFESSQFGLKQLNFPLAPLQLLITLITKVFQRAQPLALLPTSSSVDRKLSAALAIDRRSLARARSGSRCLKSGDTVVQGSRHTTAKFGVHEVQHPPASIALASSPKTAATVRFGVKVRLGAVGNALTMKALNRASVERVRVHSGIESQFVKQVT